MLNSSIQKSHLCLVLVLLSLFSNPSFANAVKEAGTIITIKGQAWASQPNQTRRTLSEQSVVYENDLIKTGEKSSLKILFTDNTKFDLGPKTDLLISKFKYKKSAEEDGIAMKLLKGSFRFVSGLIAKTKPASMKINTTVATIGIRGTHVAGEVESTSAKIVLMEPEDPSSKTAIEVSNDFGSVTIDEPGYGTEIPDEFSPPSPPRRMRLQTITNLTRSLQSIQRINTPRPRVP
jgi:FecR protein